MNIKFNQQEKEGREIFVNCFLTGESFETLSKENLNKVITFLGKIYSVSATKKNWTEEQMAEIKAINRLINRLGNT